MVYSYLYNRIGNNLFQIAAGVSLAKKMNVPYQAIIGNYMTTEPDNCSLSEYLNQFRNNILRNIDLVSSVPSEIAEYKEPTFEYSPLPVKDEIMLNGLFQSEKYFDKELVRNLFSIDTNTCEYIVKKYGLILDKETVSVVVRRGDYLKYSRFHTVCTMSYYQKAIDYIGRNKHFLIISDDIEWCKKKIKGENISFVEDEVPVVDLYLQSMCTHNIISNSSFAWWGAWLNPNPHKVVIYPSHWFGYRYRKLNTADMLPKEWVCVPAQSEFKTQMSYIYYFITGIGRKIVRFILNLIQQK